MDNSTQSFEQEFMHKVKHGAEVAKKKPKFDWKIITAFGVAAVVIVGWIVFMVVQGSKPVNNTADEAENSAAKAFILGNWSCDDGTKVAFRENGTATWNDGTKDSSGDYLVSENGKAFAFGGVGGLIESETIRIARMDSETVCRKEQI